MGSAAIQRQPSHCASSDGCPKRRPLSTDIPGAPVKKLRCAYRACAAASNPSIEAGDAVRALQLYEDHFHSNILDCLRNCPASPNALAELSPATPREATERTNEEDMTNVLEEDQGHRGVTPPPPSSLASCDCHSPAKTPASTVSSSYTAVTAKKSAFDYENNDQQHDLDECYDVGSCRRSGRLNQAPPAIGDLATPYVGFGPVAPQPRFFSLSALGTPLIPSALSTAGPAGPFVTPLALYAAAPVSGFQLHATTVKAQEGTCAADAGGELVDQPHSAECGLPPPTGLQMLAYPPPTATPFLGLPFSGPSAAAAYVSPAGGSDDPVATAELSHETEGPSKETKQPRVTRPRRTRPVKYKKDTADAEPPRRRVRPTLPRKKSFGSNRSVVSYTSPPFI